MVTGAHAEMFSKRIYIDLICFFYHFYVTETRPGAQGPNRNYSTNGLT